MILPALALALMSETETVSDYFPVKPGTTWVYQSNAEVNGRKSFSTDSDTVLEPVLLNGITYTVIESRGVNSAASRSFYEVTADQIGFAGMSENALLPLPFTILQGDPTKAHDWEFTGGVVVGTAEAPAEIKARLKPLGTRDVVGRKVPVIEVVMDMKIFYSEDQTITATHTSLYGKGIGLIEFKEVGSFGTQKNQKVRKLARFREATP